VTGAIPCAAGLQWLVKAKQGAEVPGDLTCCVLKGREVKRVIVIDVEHENRHAVEIRSKKLSRMVAW